MILLTFLPAVCWTGDMSVHLFDGALSGLPVEASLLAEVTVRLLEDSEQARFDQELTTKHYLKNATAVGRVLRYVVEYRGQWVALAVFSSPAFHLKLRDQWLRWSARQVKERRHLIAQNSRFLVLAAPGQWPNLASRGLKLICQRLPQDSTIRCGWPKPLSIRNGFGAPATKLPAGNSWGRPKAMRGTGRTFTPTPGIPSNCGCELWERMPWSKSGRRSWLWSWPIRKGRCRQPVRSAPPG